MKITWFSNAPWAPTGYGMQTAEVVPRIIAAGHEVVVAANYGLNGTPLDWEGIKVFPAGVESHSTALSPAHHEAWGGDWMLTLYDVWPLKREFFPERTVSWVPVDHDPVPPEVARWCKTVRPIAMSRFGERMLRQQGIEPGYIPHSVNTSIFTADGPHARAALEVPADAYLVVINAANKGLVPARKAWFEMFAACALFMGEHPDVYLYVHTDSNSPIGLKLEKLARVTGIPPDRLRWADPYAIATGTVTAEDLAGYYRSGDVLLATSMGEGFGIPVVEAQACGLPVIVSNFSAQPELCGAGWGVKGQSWWDEAQDSILFTPSISSILTTLGTAYAARGDNGLRERAVAFAAKYDSDVVFDAYWKPLLAELQASLLQDQAKERLNRIADKDFSPPRNRAERRAAKKRKRAA